MLTFGARKTCTIKKNQFLTHERNEYHFLAFQNAKNRLKSLFLSFKGVLKYSSNPVYLAFLSVFGKKKCKKGDFSMFCKKIELLKGKGVKNPTKKPIETRYGIV